MIPKIDIWRAAQLMLKPYGDQALKESAARATELTLASDDDGAATWHRIMEAVTQLAQHHALRTSPLSKETAGGRSDLAASWSWADDALVDHRTPL